MNKDNEFDKFMHAEVKYIDDAKWYEGIRINNDPGDTFVQDWISRHSIEFRTKWDKSVCRTCILCRACGNNVKEQCDQYISEK